MQTKYASLIDIQEQVINQAVKQIKFTTHEITTEGNQFILQICSWL